MALFNLRFVSEYVEKVLKTGIIFQSEESKRIYFSLNENFLYHMPTHILNSFKRAFRYNSGLF